MSSQGKFAEILTRRENEILSQWLELQNSTRKKLSANDQQEVTRQSRDFMQAFKAATQKGSLHDISGAEWAKVRELLSDLSANRAKGGYTPVETATFIFSLKKPIFSVLREELGADAVALADATWQATELLDKLGLLTTEMFQRCFRRRAKS